MAQTKVFAAIKGTVVRKNRINGSTAGQGQSHRWYVGRHGSYDYDVYIRFDHDWTDVGSITSAVLTVYTGDGLGDTPSTTNEHPEMVIRRLTDGFTEGNAPNGTWQSNDYTVAAGSSSGSKRVYPQRAELAVNNFDVTTMLRAMAPSTVSGGGKASNHGFGFYGTTDTDKNIDFVSDKWPATELRPYITVTYEYGKTVPDAPTAMAPSGTVAAFTDLQADFTDVRATDKLARSFAQVFTEVTGGTASASGNAITSAGHGLKAGDYIYFTSLTGGAGLDLVSRYYVLSSGLTANAFKVSPTLNGSVEDVTTDYTDLTWGKLLYNGVKDCSPAEITAAHFTHVPDSLTLLPNTPYQWRAKVTDNEGQTSVWTDFVSFDFSNTAPDAPTLTPADAAEFVNPDGVLFRGTFSDDDAGDTLLAYEVQMSAYAEGDAHWDDTAFILWNTGKRYVAPGTTQMETPYGGAALAAGTYYWRARVYDNHHAVSNWTYQSIVFTGSFEPDPEAVVTAIQLRPRAPWRLVFRDMGANRGPGDVVAIIEDAKNVGASELYNSPGELHFTIPKNHPQISVLEPRQTHYAVEFRQGDGWHEVFAGLLMDFDASDTDVIFYGSDYLGLLDFIVDERYDPANPDKPAEKGGSKYVTTGKNSISYIVTDQLAKARALPNSPVKFISTGTIASMSETLVVYSTYSPVLQFVVGLLDSHRGAGSSTGDGKRTRLRVRKTNAGGYEFIVQDAPGVVRDNLRFRYGELVQGYRIVAFGSDWATTVHGIGRLKDGVKVLYDKKSAIGIDEATWGRFTQVRVFDGVADANDLKRRLQQAANTAGHLGKQVGLGIRSGVIQPKDGYEVCDIFPIDIEDGSVSTAAFGSGYWVAVGVTWETNAQDGKQNTYLTFQPREDAEEPDEDLLVLQPISEQAQWQIGWSDPNPLSASSKYWLDQSTGIVYVRVDGTLVAEGITGSA
jgi:hypothetical protein